MSGRSYEKNLLSIVLPCPVSCKENVQSKANFRCSLVTRFPTTSSTTSFFVFAEFWKRKPSFPVTLCLSPLEYSGTLSAKFLVLCPEILTQLLKIIKIHKSC